MERRLGLMLDSAMPAHWAVETVFADAAEKLKDEPTTALLDSYLAARLQAEIPGLVRAGLLEPEAVLGLHGDGKRAWAAVRAVALLSEAERLRELAQTSEDEFAVSALLLATRCEDVARSDLLAPPNGVCAMAAFVFALAHGLTRNPRQRRVYEGDVIARHRQLLEAACGRKVDAPVFAADFADVGAIQGISEYELKRYGWAPPLGVFSPLPEAWVSYARINHELEANGGWSWTLIHELLHTLQGETVWPKNQEEATMHTVLEEGVTEAQARRLTFAYVPEFDAAIYTPHIVFALTLVEVAAGGDLERSRELLAELAFASHAERPPLAAKMLTDDNDPETVLALGTAICEYSVYAIENTEPRTFQEIREKALEVLGG
jgi:hypothetical protein